MDSTIGQVIGIDPQGLANALKGNEWNIRLNGKLYVIEFNGTTSGDGILLAKVKGSARSKQLPTIHPVETEKSEE